MSSIVLNNLKKNYGAKTIIERLNLRIDAGSFTVLVGPSGCGKSTVLRMIAGLESVTGGDIYIGEKSMASVEPGKRGVAMVFQNYALYPTMTVNGNIEYGLKNNKVPKNERSRIINEIAKTVGLTAHLNKKPHQLSGGERQRVALARAMVKKPQVFLMDEPLSNLDAKLRQDLRTQLIKLHRDIGATFVYVTHDQVEAMSMGTKVVLMNSGEIVQEGSPHTIYTDPKSIFSAKFIGTPPMNIIGVDLCKNMNDFGLPASARYIGFRPEKIKFVADDEFSHKKGIKLRGQLITHEVLGSEVLYKIQLENGEMITVKYFDDLDLRFDKTEVFIKKKHLFLFDETGERLCRELNEEAGA